MVAPLLARESESISEELQLNIVRAFLVIKHSVPHMVERGGGSIVCVSSDASKLSWPFMIGYSTAKAGLDAMVRTAADEPGHLQIRVNAVRPGLTQTAIASSVRLFENTALIEEFVREKPLGRTGVPDDIAAGIRYFAGPESAWVTGQSLAIEGGNELRKAPSFEGLARKRLEIPWWKRLWQGAYPSFRSMWGAGFRPQDSNVFDRRSREASASTVGSLLF